MPKGLTQTSSTVAIGYSVTESAANTFTQTSVDLNLSPLDREVFVVQAIDMDLTPPDMIGSTNTNVAAALCLLYTSPSPRDRTRSRMPSSA